MSLSAANMASAFLQAQALCSYAAWLVCNGMVLQVGEAMGQGQSGRKRMEAEAHTQNCSSKTDSLACGLPGWLRCLSFIEWHEPLSPWELHKLLFWPV